MGITQTGLTIISKYPSKRVLSLGYPDLVVRPEFVEELFRVKPMTLVSNGGWHGVDHDLPETVEFFDMIGAELTCVDINKSRGVEEIIDLNYPHDLGKYNMVIDPGTIEHCFNIGQAIINAANAVEMGGVILHTPPVSMVNHGFYNINPTCLADFYRQNGWDIELCVGVRKEELYQLPLTQRVQVPPESSMYFVARRTNMNKLEFPMQSKYLSNPSLGAVH